MLIFACFSHALISGSLGYFKGCATTSVDSKRVANYNGIAIRWWLRSPITSSTAYAWYVGANGNCAYLSCTESWGVRPALILPSSLLVSDDGTVKTNTAPAAPSGISVPASINGGSTVTVSWNAATDAV